MNWFTATHVLRQANGSADVMAKLGINQQEALRLWPDPPDAVAANLLADSLGIISFRL